MPAAAITGAVETTACREMLLNQINNLNDGAFAPWSTQPVVKAVLLPPLIHPPTPCSDVL
jgi:hypothetical protein